MTEHFMLNIYDNLEEPILSEINDELKKITGENPTEEMQSIRQKIREITFKNNLVSPEDVNEFTRLLVNNVVISLGLGINYFV